MDRYEYLGTVKYHLQSLPTKRQDKIIDKLMNRFRDSEDDDALIKELGAPESLAEKYLYSKKDLTIDEDITHFSFETTFVPVYVYESDDEDLHFNVTKDIDLENVQYEIKDGVFHLNLKLSHANKNTRLDIYLPDKEIERLEMTQHYSSIHADSIKAKDLLFKNDVGQVLVKRVEADTLTCYLQTGEMRIDDVDTNHLKFNVSTGKLVLDNVNPDQHIDGKVATGNAMVTLKEMFKNNELTLKEQFGLLDIEGYDDTLDGEVLGDGEYKVKLVVSYGTLMIDTN
ncbi:DUF4097 family beta strand repeat-containing protein [Nosocomiicoccus sp. HMSC059G07]|uniref:DUF4097 family beta strand repeat-containing protein n=1 Tax=Nosocomiicoccus sp. HMSC059G07 TaxID=1739531 RepID=UPI0008A3AAFA|nr:DUF4097 family beta strand repeat-containing protein [Nosocomiicoccus sp. HMSC059G07]OFO54477.1 hypothetical protein HMPREF3029_05055 [Nosocomiicoccus sp. HMSC059G07]